jgi:AmiR/NasT family two-component response regulator
LKFALESRVVIEQAKGIIAEHKKITVDDAFNQLRSFARSHNRLLSDSARQIIDGSLSSDDLDRPAPVSASERHGE